MDEITFKDFLQGKSRNYQTDCNVEMNKEKASIYLKEKLSTIQQKKPKDARIKKTVFKLPILIKKITCNRKHCRYRNHYEYNQYLIMPLENYSWK